MKAKHLLFAAVAVAVLAVTVAPEALSAYMDPSALLVSIPVALSGMVGDIDLIRSKQLREQRANLVEENGKLLKRIGEEKDAARVKELETEWDRRDNEIVALTAAIERAEKQEANERDMLRPVNERRSGRHMPQQQQSVDDHKEAYKRAFDSYLRFGPMDMTPEERQVLRAGYKPVGRNGVIDNPTNAQEQRAMSTTVAAGGYTIPEGFFNELQENLLHVGGVRPMCEVLTTDSGNTIPMPTEDDTSNEASIVGEGSALTSPQDPGFGVINLGAFTYRSLILASLELLQDTAFVTETYIRKKLVTRVFRGTNRHFTVGNGSTQPHGFVPASSSGRTAASATAISFTDLTELEHSVDPSYRMGPKVGWQMADGTLKIIKQLVDGQSRPLWLPGLAVREPDTILGYRYGINQHMAAVAASNKSLAFGDWSKYLIRDVRNALIVRANELHIGSGQIGFYVFSRHDGKLVDAGTDPIKHLTHPSPN